MDNLFLVASPYQLINATEAKHKLIYEGNTCLILFFSGQKSEVKQLREMAKSLKWDVVVEFFGFQDNVAFSFVKRLAFVWSMCFKSRRKCKQVFIGDFKVSFFHYVVSAVSPEKVIFLDDGAATLNVHADYLSKGNFFPHRKNVLLDRIEYIIFFPFSAFLHKKRSLLLFTSYNLENVEQVSILKNKFESLKMEGKEGKVENSLIWLIGSPYSEAGIMDLESELLLIRKAVEFLLLRGDRVDYYAHRRDSDHKLSRIVDIDGISELKRSSFPIEYEYCVNSLVKPGSIAGFYTTALDTLSELGRFNDIYSFEIPDKFSNESVSCVYDYYRGRGYSVFRL